jgi:hypothetical protein
MEETPMCRRRALRSLDPFSPFRADVAPVVVDLMSKIAAAHAEGWDLVEQILKSSRSFTIKAFVGLALRHLGRENGGECLDTTRRERGRKLGGSLAQRVARRLHVRPELLHALTNLAMLPVPGFVWDLIDADQIDPVGLWKSLVEKPDFRESVLAWGKSGCPDQIPRGLVYAILNGGNADPRAWAPWRYGAHDGTTVHAPS